MERSSRARIADARRKRETMAKKLWRSRAALAAQADLLAFRRRPQQ
jgi:hypothetical protein